MSDSDLRFRGAKLVKRGQNSILIVSKYNIRFLIKSDTVHCAYRNPDLVAIYTDLNQLFEHANQQHPETMITNINQIQLPDIFQLPGSAPDS